MSLSDLFLKDDKNWTKEDQKLFRKIELKRIGRIAINVFIALFLIILCTSGFAGETIGIGILAICFILALLDNWYGKLS